MSHVCYCPHFSTDISIIALAKAAGPNPNSGFSTPLASTCSHLQTPYLTAKIFLFSFSFLSKNNNKRTIFTSPHGTFQCFFFFFTSNRICWVELCTPSKDGSTAACRFEPRTFFVKVTKLKIPLRGSQPRYPWLCFISNGKYCVIRRGGVDEEAQKTERTEEMRGGGSS